MTVTVTGGLMVCVTSTNTTLILNSLTLTMYHHLDILLLLLSNNVVSFRLISMMDDGKGDGDGEDQDLRSVH